MNSRPNLEAEEAFAVVRAIRSVMDQTLAEDRIQLDRIMEVLDGTDIGAIGGRRHAAPAPLEPSDWADRPTPEDAAIKAAFPTRSGRHDLYAEAMRLVGDRHSKGALVALVTWLLLRVEQASVSLEGGP